MPDPTNCIPWELNPGDCDDEWAGLDPDLQERATALAWSSMRTLTAGQIGSCPVVLRPCAPEVVCGCVPDCDHPTNVNCGASPCDVCAVCEVRVPGKVAGVLSISLDGVSYTSADTFWRVDDHSRIVRIDGGCWPVSQDLSLQLNQPGTFGIEYIPGRKPGTDGLWATATLASEFAKACSGGKCRLPSNVTSVSRQGVNVVFSEGYFENGTGIREVDAYIYSVNPNRIKVPPRIWSPDQPQRRYVERV
jgi:hypothetical protein